MEGENMVIIGYIIAALMLLCMGLCLYYNIFGIFESRSNFANPTKYTVNEIKKKWTDNNCDKSKTNSIASYLSKMSKKEADSYLNYYFRSQSYCPKAKQIYSAELIDKLKTMWKNSQCKDGPFPMAYIDKLTLNKIKPENVEKAFITYMNETISNVNNNDIVKYTLNESYGTCYGSNWKSNAMLNNKYNLVSD